MVRMMMNKSIEELENSYWEDSDFDSYVVRTVQTARKKPLSELTDEEIRVLVSQKVGLKYVLPMAVAILKRNPLTEASLYEGDLLECMLRLSSSDWSNNPEELRELRLIVQTNQSAFDEEITELMKNFLQSEEV